MRTAAKRRLSKPQAASPRPRAHGHASLNARICLRVHANDRSTGQPLGHAVGEYFLHWLKRGFAARRGAPRWGPPRSGRFAPCAHPHRTPRLGHDYGAPVVRPERRCRSVQLLPAPEPTPLPRRRPIQVAFDLRHAGKDHVVNSPEVVQQRVNQCLITCQLLPIYIASSGAISAPVTRLEALCGCPSIGPVRDPKLTWPLWSSVPQVPKIASMKTSRPSAWS